MIGTSGVDSAYELQGSSVIARFFSPVDNTFASVRQKMERDPRVCRGVCLFPYISVAVRAFRGMKSYGMYNLLLGTQSLLLNNGPHQSPFSVCLFTQ